jgi:arginyl-tRNA synthetase
MLPHKQIEARLQAAVSAVVPTADVTAVLVRPCPDARFGDYQTNALMAIAKAQNQKPRALAEAVVAKLALSDLCETVEIAGAGFLNFRLKIPALEKALEDLFNHGELSVVRRKTIVVDFSSPNVAKPMHVGHIRSTCIGDALQRSFRALGHHVITDNHIGDWGTQFGKLLLGWKTHLDRPALERDAVAELERLYKLINAECESQPARTEEARAELVKLQAGDPENLRIWEEMSRLSQVQFKDLYARLGVQFDQALGESFYNPWLGQLVSDLLASGVARESEGAVGIFSDGSLPPKEDPFLVNRDGEWVADPALIRKSDGGFNYMTTDLATIDYRIKTWAPDEIYYVVDDRQGPHFKKLFLAFARWQPDAAKKVKLIHVGFGKILGPDGRPFRTRAGDTVKLGDLLDEAEERAFNLVTQKSPDLPEAQRREIARAVGVSAVKYADLLPNRQTDYTFDWEKMLALNGNTGPYLQYAYVRIQSIFRNAEAAGIAAGPGTRIVLSVPDEILLAKRLLVFGVALEQVVEDLRPNILCNYLYDLAAQYSRFFENCPVLTADGPTRDSRLLLCQLTARVLKQGFDVLGLRTIDQM